MKKNKFEYVLKYILINIYKKLPKTKKKVRKFYLSNTSIFSYLFVISIMVIFPIQLALYMFSTHYFYTNNLSTRINGDTYEEQAQLISAYNNRLSYSVSDNIFHKSMYKVLSIDDIDYLYKRSDPNAQIRQKGMITYNLFDTEFNVYTLSINGRKSITGIPENIFYDCMDRSFEYMEPLNYINSCSRFVYIALTSIKFNPFEDKVHFVSKDTIEIIYNDGKTLNIQYGDLKYVREFHQGERRN